MYFGKNIKYLRQKRGLTQEEVGTICGVQPTTVGGWEKEDSFPYFKVLLTMRELFEVDLESLVYRDLEKDGLLVVMEPGLEYHRSNEEELNALREEIAALRALIERAKLVEKKMEVIETRIELREKQGDAVVGELTKMKGK